jgi:predicted HAD superfamily Cof-like phosphohydrolase
MAKTETLVEFHKHIGAPVAVPPETDHTFNRVISILTNASMTVIDIHESLNTGPAPQGNALAILRIRLCLEELTEMALALANFKYGDNSPAKMAELADSIGDLEYVVRGTGVTYGIDLDKVHEIIHSSNMSKRGMNEHSKGGKGEGYVDPTSQLVALFSTNE